TLRRYKMKLNPAKCKFGVKSGKFLGYMVTERGIEVNPEKVRAVLEMQPPRTIKEVQILTGRLAGLSRFIARAAERSFPFFRTLRKGARFEWSSQAQEAFDKLKEFLASLPLLTKPDPTDVLILYLSVGEVAISSVLLKEDGGGQQPIYYVSKLLQGAEMKYAEVEKAALALIITARKLRPYFLSHGVVVRTNFPLNETLGRPSASGRMVKWAVELGEYNVSFEARKAIKAQALADFIREGTMVEKPGVWEVYVDGSSTKVGAGIGILILPPGGEPLEFAVKLTFRASNNEAEYEALLKGMQLVASAGARKVVIHSDSQLVVEQTKGDYEAREERMGKYADEARALAKSFESWQL
ncbi:Unknown protein, partial [Striga hermonthica]